MSTDLANALSTAERVSVHPPRSVVAATDGTEDSEAAVLFARSLVTRYGSVTRAFSVCEPLPVIYDWGQVAPIYVPEDIELSISNRMAAAKTQLARLLGADAKCPLVVRTGLMANEVAAYAAETKADLIVAGRGRHKFLDRLVGEEHLSRLLRLATCPVLAIEPTLKSAPRRVVIGIDFAPHTMDVAATAATLMAEDAVVYLVHVKPDPPFGVPHPGQWLKSYDDGVRTGLERVQAQLALPPSHVVEPIVISGHPGVALAEFAQRAGADMIAVGVHGAGFFNRLVIGSVPTYLLRGAPCSLLAVPVPHEAPAK